MKKSYYLIMSVFLLLTGCSTLTQTEIQEKRTAMDTMA